MIQFFKPRMSGFFFVKIFASIHQVNDVNILRTVVQASVNEKDVYNVFWMAGLVRKGLVKVKVRPYLEKRYVAAELAAIRWLLEEANVCGHDKTGAGLQLFFASQDTVDLVQRISLAVYLAPYANFIHTRFYGCETQLDGDPSWADEDCLKNVVEISGEPKLTTINVAGVGEVDLTAHAVEMYVRRFDREPTRAWRELIKHAQTARPIYFPNRHPVFDVQHKNPGKHYLTKNGHVLVITPPTDHGEKPQLVTVTKQSSLQATFSVEPLQAAN